MKLKYLYIYSAFFLILASSTVFLLQSIDGGDTKQEPVREVVAKSQYEKIPKADESELHDEVHGNLHEKLQTSVQFTASELIVTNGENTDLENCTFELNQTIVQRGYMYTQDVIPAQESVAISLEQFTRDGIIFDPTQRKAQNVMIMCDEASGKSGWNYVANR